MEWPWRRKHREKEEAEQRAKKVAADLALKRVYERSEEIRRERETEELLRRTIEAQMTQAALGQSGEMDTDEEVIEVFELGSPTPTITFRVKRDRRPGVTEDDLDYVRRSLGLEP